MNEVLNIIKSRRSVRAYKSDLLGKAELDAIVEAGIYAPSGHNQQPWHFTVIQDREVIGSINRKCKAVMAGTGVEWIKKIGTNPAVDITHNAPVLIIISCRKDSVSGKADCVAAMQNMLLQAESMSIGSCWMGFVGFIFGDAEEMRLLGVPEGYEAQQASVFGYKVDAEKKEGPPRNRDVVNFIGQF
jgi:nitroreductase